MEDILSMIQAFNDRGYTLDQISEITGYSKEELQKCV